MARKFLYVIAFLIALVLAAGVAWQLFGMQLMQKAFVPGETFRAPTPVATNAYAEKAMWIARPDLPGNPAQWLPEGGVAEDADAPVHAVFFIHPTSYLTRTHWNAPLDDKEANERAALFIRGQASVFNKTRNVWAPRYRQAAFGAFLTDDAQAQRALDVAFADVAAAFDHFAAATGKAPIVLAGHSQGGLHLIRLLTERVKDKPVAKRLVAAYAVGWPIAMNADLPALGLPACATPEQTGCILSWQSFAEPAEHADIARFFEAKPGLTGKTRKGDPLLCTNPLTGKLGGAAPASANFGMLKNKPDFSGGTLSKNGVPARCDAGGYLLIGDPPEMGPYVLPGNNYHVYDYSLFWANIRADVERRTRAFPAR